MFYCTNRKHPNPNLLMLSMYLRIIKQYLGLSSVYYVVDRNIFPRKCRIRLNDNDSPKVADSLSPIIALSGVIHVAIKQRCAVDLLPVCCSLYKCNGSYLNKRAVKNAF